MSPTPTGRLTGTDLVLTRTFRAPAPDVWDSLTDPERTARWFGPWTGEPGPGNPIRVRMVHEEGSPWIDMTIEECEPPRRLALSSPGEYGFRVELELAERDGSTELRFTQHLTGAEGVGELGPGWEYYLDGLVAARADRPMPSFGDYYPAMKEHYDGLR